MYDQSELSELITFARVGPGCTVIDVYPGDGPAQGLKLKQLSAVTVIGRATITNQS